MAGVIYTVCNENIRTMKNKNEMKTICDGKQFIFTANNMVQPSFNNEEAYIEVGLIENELK